MSRHELQEAFVLGAQHIREVYDLHISSRTAGADISAAREAFPPPTETRPREVTITFKGLELQAQYRFVDGVFEMFTGGQWHESSSVYYEDGEVFFEVACFTPEGMAALAGLIEEPNETVELDD